MTKPIDLTTGLQCGNAPASPRLKAWAVKYGNGVERIALFLDRARAEQAARDLHGITILLVEPEENHGVR